MERNEYAQVRGELTDAIVQDLEFIVEDCLSAIERIPFSEEFNSYEIEFLRQLKHLDFFDMTLAKDYAEQYNGLQLQRMGPEEIFSYGIKKLIFDKEFLSKSKTFSPQKFIGDSARYFIEGIVDQIKSDPYTTSISALDEIYLKLVQAVHTKVPSTASVLAYDYNKMQTNLKDKSETKLKKIEHIGTKLGYGIVLE